MWPPCSIKQRKERPSLLSRQRGAVAEGQETQFFFSSGRRGSLDVPQRKVHLSRFLLVNGRDLVLVVDRYSKVEYFATLHRHLAQLQRHESMDKEQRRKAIAHKLVDMGDTVNSWAKKNGLHQRIVVDLIDGKLTGTRGVSLETRRKMEEAFGKIFDDE